MCCWACTIHTECSNVLLAMAKAKKCRGKAARIMKERLERLQSQRPSLYAPKSAAPSTSTAPNTGMPSLSPLPFSQVNGYIPPVDGMRIDPRCHASRGDQYASNALRGSFGGQLLADYWEVRYITRMCPFRPRSRHMQQISGQYWKLVFFNPQ